jgi:DNA replication and repair protein RecF
VPIGSLEIENFRCFDRAHIDFDARCTVISGANAGGKTTVLEAVHVLSTGHSFRTSHPELLVRDGCDEFLIAGQVDHRSRSVSAGVKWSSEGREVHYDGTKLRGVAVLAAALPVRVIDPSSHRLIEEGPSQRRRFMDWGVFHVERRFHEVWQAYKTALAQRNAALRAQQPRNLVRSWDRALAVNGEEITRMREAYLKALEPTAATFIGALLGVSGSLNIRAGWDANGSLARQLEEGWARDSRFRTTSLGPHRAELEILIAGKAAKDCISRGQQKLLACALILAQLHHHVDSGGDPGTLLLDDPAAELDVDNLGKLMQMISGIAAQVAVTAVDSATTEIINPGKKFHVKQGRIDPVV